MLQLLCCFYLLIHYTLVTQVYTSFPFVFATPQSTSFRDKKKRVTKARISSYLKTICTFKLNELNRVYHVAQQEWENKKRTTKEEQICTKSKIVSKLISLWWWDPTYKTRVIEISSSLPRSQTTSQHSKLNTCFIFQNPRAAAPR